MARHRDITLRNDIFEPRWDEIQNITAEDAPLRVIGEKGLAEGKGRRAVARPLGGVYHRERI